LLVFGMMVVGCGGGGGDDPDDPNNPYNPNKPVNPGKPSETFNSIDAFASWLNVQLISLDNTIVV